MAVPYRDWNQIVADHAPLPPPPEHCGRPAVLEPRGLYIVWRCANRAGCDARVGVHPGTLRPLGTLATGPTREARIAAHHALDALWRSSTRPGARARVYRALAQALAIPEAHIGEFTTEQCHAVIEWARTQEAF